MTIFAKDTDDLNVIFNNKTIEPLVVNLPKGCTFRQKVFIERDNLTVNGNGSKIVWDDHNGMRPGFGTGASATLTVCSKHTLFKDLVVENDFDYLANEAKPGENPVRMMGRQAVAVFTTTESTDSTFIGCRFSSWQDTLFTDGVEDRFENCEISGNIDFIFGRSHAIFKHCTIISVGPGFVSAPSTSEDKNEGLCFVDCILTCTNDVPDGSVYLARPWHPSERSNVNSCISFKNCKLGRHINAELWTTMWDKKGHNHLPSENRFSIDEQTLNTLK